jgi:hypothetical protein
MRVSKRESGLLVVEEGRSAAGLVGAVSDYPFIVAPSLLGMKGLRMRGSFDAVIGTAIPREVVLLPDVIVERDDVNIPTVLRPLFDALWQCVGVERSPSYGPDGTWNPKR